MQHEFAHALSAAQFFRSIGLVPLPSRMDRKQPTLLDYKQYRDIRVPKVVYSPDQWRTTNLQLITGTKSSGATKIVVVDLDGDKAMDAWKKLCQRHDYRVQSVWVAASGSGGRHVYYRLPLDVKECRTRLMWGLYDPFGGQDGRGGWTNHTEVKLLGDNALVVAPPSRHVKTGIQYHWVGRFTPARIPLPEFAPTWLLEMEGLQLPVQPVPAAPATRRVMGFKLSGRDDGCDEVITAISPEEKLRLVTLWGLKLASRHTAARGWVECHAIDREDTIPSAGFDPRTGVYHDFGSARSLSLFGLAVAIGAYPSKSEALRVLRNYAKVT